MYALKYLFYFAGIFSFIAVLIIRNYHSSNISLPAKMLLNQLNFFGSDNGFNSQLFSRYLDFKRNPDVISSAE